MYNEQEYSCNCLVVVQVRGRSYKINTGNRHGPRLSYRVVMERIELTGVILIYLRRCAVSCSSEKAKNRTIVRF